MNRLEAHELFDRRGDDHTALDADASINGVCCWPACATAACELSGMLEDAHDDRGLDEALEHFQAIYEAGIIGDEQWQETSFEILADLEAWGESVDRQSALN